MGEIKRNIVVLQALHNVPVQSVGIRHQLHAGENLRALQRHAARHNQADVTGAEDDDPFADHVAFHIDVALRGARGENTRGTVARNADSAAGSLSAAHGQNNRLRLNDLIAVPAVYTVNLFSARNFQHHGVQLHLHIGVPQHLNKPLGIFGARQLLFKVMESEPVVNTLVENAAQFLVALQNQDALCAVMVSLQSGREPRGAAADDN